MLEAGGCVAIGTVRLNANTLPQAMSIRIEFLAVLDG